MKISFKKSRTSIAFILSLLLMLTLPVFADSLRTVVHSEYPRELYIVGIGEVPKTGNIYNDKRVAEIMARVEIARQIKVRMQEATVDVACEGAIRVYADSTECKNKFLMIIRQSVDEVLEGSKIVDYREADERVYAVAVLPRNKAAEDLERNYRHSIDKAKKSLEKSGKGDSNSLEDAREEYVKAVAYNKEKEVIGGVKSNASEIFEELEMEIEKLSKKGD